MPSCSSRLFGPTLDATHTDSILRRFIVDSHDVRSVAFLSSLFLTLPQEENLGASSFALHSLLSEKSLAGIPLLVVSISGLDLKNH